MHQPEKEKNVVTRRGSFARVVVLSSALLLGTSLAATGQAAIHASAHPAKASQVQASRDDGKVRFLREPEERRRRFFFDRCDFDRSDRFDFDDDDGDGDADSFKERPRRHEFIRDICEPRVFRHHVRRDLDVQHADLKQKERQKVKVKQNVDVDVKGFKN